MSKQTLVQTALAFLWVLSTQAHASYWGDDVSVEIVGARGEVFEQYPVSRSGLDRGDAKSSRAYLRAERGAPYRVRVRNTTGERVGVVVAVDGRNIISGAKSDLARNEPMYVLSPWESREYSGWRTNLEDVHEFYFTEWEDSYAEAFGDRSARGVIAVAVYREQQRFWPAVPPKPYTQNEESSGRTSRDEAQSRRESSAEPQSAPGTGFGDRRYEPATRVEFKAQRHASTRVFLKYEWPETLCRKAIADCDSEPNRFWDEELSFAPYPPRRLR